MSNIEYQAMSDEELVYRLERLVFVFAVLNHRATATSCASDPIRPASLVDEPVAFSIID